MKAQEKAKELVKKFKNFEYADDSHIVIHKSPFRAAKQCALTAVDEIIASYTDNLQEFHIDFIDHNPIDHWQQVKEEIEKL